MKKMICLSTWFIGFFFFILSAWAYQPFPDTGQTKCYNNSSEITCPSPGQPFYGQDAQYPRIPRSYTKLGYGGTVLADSALHVDNGGPWIMTRDNVTGLIWEVKTNANKNDKYNWSNAQSVFISQLNAQNFGGFSDWRLPEIKELSSLVNRGVYNLAIDNAWFPKTVSPHYWSSTPDAGTTGLAWLVGFYSGYVYGSFLTYYVRAVRAGDVSVITNFTDNGDGTVTCTATELIWQKEATTDKYNWQQALEYAENLTLAGYSDWRLPNINELQTLVDYSYREPAIYPTFRPHTMSSHYWSSTSSARPGNTIYAWGVDFGRGNVTELIKSPNIRYVRAVRSGQSDIGQFGSLVVHIEPLAAVYAGAQWRISGATGWKNSGTTETGLHPGYYTAEFRDINFWIKPADIMAHIVQGQTTIITGTYIDAQAAPPSVPIATPPSGTLFAASPQLISVTSSGAQNIYYRLTIKSGTDSYIDDPDDPGTPDKNDSFIKGSSATLVLSANRGEFKKIKISLRAENEQGWSAASQYEYAIDLTGNNNENLIPGSLLWNYKTGGGIFLSSPAIGSDGTVYIGSSDTYIYAINPDGNIRWRYKTDDWANSSPAIDSDDTIYVGSGEYFYALNPNGTLRWNYAMGWINSSPAIGSKGTVYVGSNDGHIYALNPNGTLRWKYQTEDWIVSSPAIGSDETIYVGSNDGKIYAINPNGTLRWNYQTGSRVTGSPAIDSCGTVYVGSEDGYLHAMNPDGTLRFNYQIGGRTSSSPAIGPEGIIYIGSEDGYLYALKPKVFGPIHYGVSHWKYPTGDRIFSSPAIGSDGVIYVGSEDNHLYALNPDGTLQWKHQTGNRVISSPAIGPNGAIYVGSVDGYLYTFKSSSKCLVKSSWPMFGADIRHTRNADNQIGRTVLPGVMMLLLDE